jgi:hypothetical protein
MNVLNTNGMADSFTRVFVCGFAIGESFFDPAAPHENGSRVGRMGMRTIVSLVGYYRRNRCLANSQGTP